MASVLADLLDNWGGTGMGVRCACPAGLGSIWALSESWLAECFGVAGWPLWVACVQSLPGCEVRGTVRVVAREGAPGLAGRT